MKTNIFVILLLLSSGIGRADATDGQTAEPLPWKTIPGLPSSAKGEIEPIPGKNDSSNTLKITYSGKNGMETELRPFTFVVDHFGIKFHHYAITGEVRTENVSHGSYLTFGYSSPSTGGRGSIRELEGTIDWLPLQLEFDASSEKGGLYLDLTGPGTVYLRNLKLVQYPEANAITADQAKSGEGITQLIIHVRKNPDGTILYSTLGDNRTFEQIQQLLEAFRGERGDSRAFSS